MRRIDNKKQKIDDKYDSDSSYFKSYAHLDIHEYMIKDSHRTNSYREAMLKNPSDFVDKTIIDVGCGTSILSIFSVQAGAKHVYAIDASDIADIAKEVVFDNHLTDKITIIKGRAEELVLDEKVDTIVSEWMGHALLYESMLNSVIDVRDKWLKENGNLYPRYAQMYLVPFTNPEYYNEKVSFWSEDLYGIDFRSVQKYVKSTFNEAVIGEFRPQDEISFPALIKEIDCLTVSKEEVLDLKMEFSFQSILTGELNGFALWFDVLFTGSHQDVRLSTSPRRESTHWKQTMFYLEEPIDIKQDDTLKGWISIKKNREVKRSINFELVFKLGEKEYRKEYKME